MTGEAKPHRDPFARSTTFPNAVYRHLDAIGPNGFLVYVTLEKFAWNGKRSCNPSIPTICHLTRLSERTVQRAMNMLVRAGLIGREFGGRTHSTVYRLRAEKLSDREEKGDSGDTLREKKGDNRDAKGDICDGKGDKWRQERVTPVAPEASNETTNETTNETLSESDEKFNEFFEKFPNKANPRDARKAWSELQPDRATALAIIASVDAFGEQWIDDPPRWAGHPAKFLREGKWKTPPQPKKGKARCDFEFRE